MDDLLLDGPAYELVGSAYMDQWELMQEEMALLDYRIYLYYKYHQWLGPENDLKNMLGFVVTREEFEHNMAKAAQVALEEKLDDQERETLALNQRTVDFRLMQTDWARFPLLQLFRRFELDEFEKQCIILTYAASLDEKYEKICAYLQDDISKKTPSIALAVSLFMDGGAPHVFRSRFTVDSAFTGLFDREKLKNGLLVLADEVTGFLNGSLTLSGGFRLYDPAKVSASEELLVQQGVGEALDSLFSLPVSEGLLSGKSGSGKHFQIEQLCRRKGVQCVFADLKVAGQNPDMVAKAGMLSRLTASCLCLSGLESANPEEEPITPSLADAVVSLSVKRLFLLSEKPLHVNLEQPALEVDIPQLDAGERLTMFRALLAGRVVLGEDVSLEELATKFHFTPRQIVYATRQAAGLGRVSGKPVDACQMHQCCYRQVVHKLDTLASRIQPAHTWDDVILPQATKRLLRQACAHVRYSHQVYGTWGFQKKVSYGRGLSILFAGVPGTGKTMCAQIMAGELNMEMYKINISQIVSKYIGETEKNLQAVFREAKNSNCILFFDECDALFGKRSEVKDSHDRNANVETAYLLQQIEEYDGVCILATNLLQNIDEAFLRRITFVIHFPFPDPRTREQIYRGLVGPQVPLDDDIDWRFLAEKFDLSGGYIKNIVVAAAFMAAQDHSPMGMKHLLNAAVNEMKKNEIVVVKEALREYADLLEE